MVTAAESVRRAVTRLTHRIETLPILALSVHTACNCRCVMCDIWKANAEKREITREDLDRHLKAIRRLRVRRVMLTGGEPLLHRNLWALCERLQQENIAITLVTTGVLLSSHVADIAAYVDELVVSIDGAPDVHDAIRRVAGGFERIARGLNLLANYSSRPRMTARSVVQRMNCGRIVQTIEAIHGTGVDHLSFLAADVSSAAFNRPQPWSVQRKAEVAVCGADAPMLAMAIREADERCQQQFDSGFIVGGVESLWRIHAYYMALAGQGPFPPTKCNAPWVSAVLEPGGTVRPCFFHPAYASAAGGELDEAINTPEAVAFRRSLDVSTHPTCARCVCTLSLSPWSQA
jgi:MoaA/NifB/PqqE/SkfB family radical SAM enzyme